METEEERQRGHRHLLGLVAIFLIFACTAITTFRVNLLSRAQVETELGKVVECTSADLRATDPMVGFKTTELEVVELERRRNAEAFGPTDRARYCSLRIAAFLKLRGAFAPALVLAGMSCLVWAVNQFMAGVGDNCFQWCGAKWRRVRSLLNRSGPAARMTFVEASLGAMTLLNFASIVYLCTQTGGVVSSPFFTLGALLIGIQVGAGITNFTRVKITAGILIALLYLFKSGEPSTELTFEALPVALSYAIMLLFQISVIVLPDEEDSKGTVQGGLLDGADVPDQPRADEAADANLKNEEDRP